VFDRFRSRGTASLLAFPAHHSHPHPRELLLEMLWPERDETLARNHLRVMLSSLRRLLEPRDIRSNFSREQDRPEW
jgi:DNA-binding SARP family transcriptional activator